MNPKAAFTLRVFAPDDVTLIDSRVVTTNGGVPVFFGHADAGGIGSFTLTKIVDGGHASIDNLCYSELAAVPPADVPLPLGFVAGLATAPLCALFAGGAAAVDARGAADPIRRRLPTAGGIAAGPGRAGPRNGRSRRAFHAYRFGTTVRAAAGGHLSATLGDLTQWQ